MTNPDLDDPRDADAPPPTEGPSQWVMLAINGLNSRLDGIDKRLRRIEILVATAIAIVAIFGALMGAISDLIEFDFVVSIQPRDAPVQPSSPGEAL